MAPLYLRYYTGTFCLFRVSRTIFYLRNIHQGQIVQNYRCRLINQCLDKILTVNITNTLFKVCGNIVCRYLKSWPFKNNSLGQLCFEQPVPEIALLF